MATLVDLPDIQRGDTIPYSFNWSDGVNPVNVQGKTLVMTFKLSSLLSDSEADLTKTVVIAANDAEGALGNVALQLEASESALLYAGVTYSYGVRLIEPGIPEAVETTIIYGSIIVKDA